MLLTDGVMGWKRSQQTVCNNIWRNMFEHYHKNSQRRDTEHGVEDDSLQDGKSDDKDHDGNSDDNDVGDRW